MYTLKGVAGQNYNQLTEAEKAAVQAAGDAAYNTYLKDITYNDGPRMGQRKAGYEGNPEQQVGFEAAQRAAESIFTARSNAIQSSEEKRATDTNAFIASNPNASSLPTNLDPNGQYAVVNGVLTSKSSISENAANEAAVKAGTMIKVPIGSGFGYIPTGSAGEANLPNIGTHNTANAANANIQPSGASATTLTPQQQQQYYASEGSKPNPLSPLAWLAQQNTPATTPTATTLLRQGTGTASAPDETVREIQKQLKITADGIFGPQTKSAIMKFQQDNGLVADGIVGPLTAAALKKSSSGVTTTETKTTSPTTTTGTTKAPDDPGNQFNTATGAPNPKWINPATGKTTLQETTEINTNANADMESMLAGFKTTLGTNVDVSDSSKLVKAITDSLSAAPVAKTSLVDTLNSKRTELGVGAKETELSTIDSEIAKLDADNKFLQEDNDNRVQSMSQINRRKSADQIIYEKARSDLSLKRTAVVNELNQKYSVIDTFMKYTGADYDNAQQEYTTKFNQAITMANLIKGVEETAKSDAERKVDNARANAQIMITTLKDKNIDFTKLDPATLLDIRNLETQAGLPSGFMKFSMEATDEPIVSIGSEYTNASGSKVVPIYTKSPSTGLVSVKTIILPGGTQDSSGSSGKKDTPKNQADDIATTVLNFERIIKEKNWKGIDPTMYKDVSAILQSEYGSDAVLKLRKAIEDAGLSVDEG